MMKTLLPLLLLALAACSKTTSYMRDSQPGPPPGPQESKVVVYRSAKWGGGKHFPIYEYVNEEGKLIGFTETDCFFEYRCAPGKHLFLTWGEGSAFIEADLAPQKTYYIRAYSKYGWWAARPGFAPVNTGSESMDKLGEIWPTLKCRELDPASAAEYASRKEDRMKKMQAGYEEGRKNPQYLKAEDGRSEPPGAPPK
jgi:hypothetical protein